MLATLPATCSMSMVALRLPLTHTIGVSNADLQVLLKAHNERNLASNQGRIDIDEKLLADLIAATKRLSAAVAKLTPPA